jgi:hypothetical protein
MESNVNNVQKFSHFRDNLQRLLISSTDGYIDDKNMVEYLATLAAVVESQKPFLKKKNPTITKFNFSNLIIHNFQVYALIFNIRECVLRWQ